MLWQLWPPWIFKITIEKFNFFLHFLDLLSVFVEDMLIYKLRTFELLT
jgi:hypothetical protein